MSSLPHALPKIKKNLEWNFRLISAFLHFLLSSEIRGDSECQLTFLNLK